MSKSNGQILLSILTPAVPSRMVQLGKLCEKIAAQIGSLPVEHLVLLDNKRRTIGEKRDALLRAAKGKYVAFCDDDDDVAGDYVAELMKAMVENPDVITFRQWSTINGAVGEIEFGLGNVNEAFVAGGKAKRNAWHVCAWRRALAILSSFPAINYGEDWAYASALCTLPNLKSAHIDKVLHFYVHDARTTEAPPPRG